MQLKYQIIKEFLKKEATKSSPKFPSIRELMREFGVSQNSVMHALRDLQHEGILQSKAGSGISVAPRTINNLPHSSGKQTEKGKILFGYVDYFSETLWKVKHSLINYAYQEKYQLIHYALPLESKENPDSWTAVLAEKYAGIILQTASREFTPKILSLLGKSKIPVIFIDSNYFYKKHPNNISFLCSDPEACGTKCMNMLIQQGHKRIAYIRNEPETDWVHEMSLACHSTAKSATINYHYLSYSIRSGDDAIFAAKKIVLENLQLIKEQNITGLVFTSAVGAFAASSLLQENGISIPAALSIVSCSDSFCAQHCLPPISVVDYEIDKMSHDAIDIISGKKQKHRKILYPPIEIQRSSIVPPRLTSTTTP